MAPWEPGELEELARLVKEPDPEPEERSFAVLVTISRTYLVESMGFTEQEAVDSVNAEPDEYLRQTSGMDEVSEQDEYRALDEWEREWYSERVQEIEK